MPLSRDIRTAVMIGVRTPLFPASFMLDRCSGEMAALLFPRRLLRCSKAKIIGTRASTVATLVTSIAWVTTVDAHIAGGISTNEVEQPIAVVEAHPASFDIPTLSFS